MEGTQSSKEKCWEMKKSQDKLRKTSMWRGRDGLHILCEVTHTKASEQVQLKRGSERDEDVYMEFIHMPKATDEYVEIFREIDICSCHLATH